MKETIENKSTLNVSFFVFLHFLCIYLSYCLHNDFVIILSMQHLLINYINVGMILYDLHETKYVRGSLLPVEIFPSSTDRNVLGMSSKKNQMNDKSLPLYEYVLLYKDGSMAKTLPGTTNIFFSSRIQGTPR